MNIASVGGPTVAADHLRFCREQRGKGWKLCGIKELAKEMRGRRDLPASQRRQVDRFLRWLAKHNPQCGCSLCVKHPDTCVPKGER